MAPKRRPLGYNSVAQQDRNATDLSRPHTPIKPQKNSSQRLSQSSVSSLISDDNVTLQNPKSKLPPKAYSSVPPVRRTLQHIGEVAAVSIALGLTIGGFVGLIGYGGPNYDTSQTTVCGDLGMLDYFSSRSDASIANILNITIAFGKLSFGLAKFIDLVWSIVVSRGGQALLGWLTYRVYTVVTLWIMETERVPYEFYTTISFSWARTWSLKTIFQTLFTTLKFRRKLLLVWMALSVSWATLWPTVTDAMIGYVAINNAMVKLLDPTLNDNYHPVDNTTFANFAEIAVRSQFAFQYYNSNGSSAAHFPVGPKLFSTGPNLALWDALYAEWKASDRAGFLLSGNHNYPHDTPETFGGSFALPSYYFQNQTYNFDYFQLPANVQCIASGSYQWGFSSGAMMGFAICNSLWVISTYVVWIIASRKSVFGRVRKLGKYRAALDIGEAITEDLESDLCAYTDEELEQVLKKGEGVKYNVVEGERSTSIGIASVDRGPLTFRFGEVYGSKSNLNK